MEKVSIYDKNKNYIASLTQWDEDVVVYAEIDEYDTTLTYNVHYFNSTSDLAYVVNSLYDGKYLSSKIPNRLLTQSKPIHGYIYADNEDSETHRNLYYFFIPVRKRPRPSDTVYIDSNDYIRIESVLQECKDYAAAAGEFVTSIEQFAMQAQSYAVGGTDTRDGEDTDNAKYYHTEIVSIKSQVSKSVQEAAQSNESALTAANAAAQSKSDAASSAQLSESYAVGGTGTRGGEDSDNAKYYYEQAKIVVNQYVEGYQPFTSIIVDVLPSLGETNKFYLIENAYGGYDKYWWIVDKNGSGKWDSFSSGGFATNNEILTYLSG